MSAADGLDRHLRPRNRRPARGCIGWLAAGAGLFAVTVALLARAALG